MPFVDPTEARNVAAPAPTSGRPPRRESPGSVPSRPTVTVQSGRRVEEGVLEHVGGVAPGLKACIPAQLDHAAQPIPVALEQVRRRLAVARLEPLNEMEGIARIVRYDSPQTLLPAQRFTSVTRLVSNELGGQRRGDGRLPHSPPVTA